EPGRFRLEVIDSGIGMDHEFLLRLFTAYEQGRTGRNFGGLGLGLVIAKAIVEGHGGTISARSDGIDRGSAFVVELPTRPVVDGTRVGDEAGRAEATPGDP